MRGKDQVMTVSVREMGSQGEFERDTRPEFIYTGLLAASEESRAATLALWVKDQGRAWVRAEVALVGVRKRGVEGDSFLA